VHQRLGVILGCPPLLGQQRDATIGRLDMEGPLRRHPLLRTAALAGLLCATAPGAAHADSLVFVKGGQVWISHTDGSGARPVTAAANHWAWPSQADDGTIFVAGGAARVNPGGTDSDGSSEIYHLDQFGAQLGSPATTPGSSSSPACPTYPPTSLRVSPDGRRAVYDMFHCDYRYPFLQDLAGGGFSSFATDYSRPQWLDATHVLITHIGPTFGNAAFAVYDTVARTGHGPSDDPYMTDRQATAARDGSRVAVLEDDGPDYIDGAHHADIRLYTTAGNDVTEPTLKCTLARDPGNIANFDAASPAFSPDGSRLVWAENDGIHTAITANLGDCGSVTERLLVAGGTYPFFGRGAVADAPSAGAPAPAAPAPSPSPVPARFVLVSSARTATLTAAGVLRLVVTPSESGSGKATGTISVPKARVVRFGTVKLKLTAGERTRITLKLAKRDARRVLAALRRTRRLTAAIRLTATSTAGHTARRTLAIRLSR
jgi:hypothetical protein